MTFNSINYALQVFGQADKEIKYETVLMFGRNMKSAPNQKPLGHLLASIDNPIHMKSVIRAIKIRTYVLSNNFQSTAKVKLINSR